MGTLVIVPCPHTHFPPPHLPVLFHLISAQAWRLRQSVVGVTHPDGCFEPCHFICSMLFIDDSNILHVLLWYSGSYGHVRLSVTYSTVCVFSTPLNTLKACCAGRKSKRFQTKTVSRAAPWLVKPLLGEYASSTYIQTQQNTRGPELRSCVQSSGLTAQTVRWHLYYVPCGVLEDSTSICFPSLLPLQSYRNQPTSPRWQKRTWLENNAA